MEAFCFKLICDFQILIFFCEPSIWNNLFRVDKPLGSARACLRKNIEPFWSKMPPHIFFFYNFWELSFSLFPVACTRLYTPLCPSVHWLVGQSYLSFLSFYIYLRSLASPLPPKYSSDLKFGPCLSAHDWGSRVCGLDLKAEGLNSGSNVLKQSWQYFAFHYTWRKSSNG